MCQQKRILRYPFFVVYYCKSWLEVLVRPSYDGQSLMGEDSVAKRRSDCQGLTARTSERFLHLAKTRVVDARPLSLPSAMPVKESLSKAHESVRGSH